MNRDSTRRRFLRLGGAMLTVGVTAGAAGCSGDGDDGGNGDNGGNGNGGNGNGGNGNGGNGGNGGAGGSTLDVVPAGATSVTYADVGGMIADDTVEALVNEVLATEAEEDESEGPTNKGEMLDEFESGYGLDPTEMDEAVGFGKTPEGLEEATPDPGELQNAVEEYSGTWFTTGWSEDDIVSAIEENSVYGGDIELESGEYNGYTTYEAPSEDVAGTDGRDGMTETAGVGDGMSGQPGLEEPGAAAPVEMGMMAVIEDGEYVVGTEAAVQDALDVAAGDMDAVGSDLRNAYDSVRGGLLKMVSSVPEVPDDSVPQATVGEDNVEIDQGQLEEIQDGAVVFYTSDGEMAMEASMRAGTEEAAGHVVEVLDGAIASAKKNIEDEELASKLDAVSIEQDGQNVTVSYANDVEGLKRIIDMIEEMTGPDVPGTPDVSTPTPTPPGDISLPV